MKDISTEPLPFPAYQGRSPYLFASYAHADSRMVFEELKRLGGQGFNIWYDEGINPSHRWTDELAAAIDGCGVFVAFITPRFVQSGNCIDEIEYALRRGRAVLPVFLEPTELPPGLELGLGSRQAIQKHRYDADGFAGKLAESIQSKLEPTGASDTSGTPAPPTAPPRPGKTGPRILMAAAALAVVAVGAGLLMNWDKPDDVPRAAAADTPSLAVLPFTNVSQDPVNDPFTVGVHDDLLTHISKIGSIKTISRTSVLQYRNTTKPIPEIARELGVTSVLEGGVQRAGDRVRINVQLVDAGSDDPLWAETYDRELTAANIFAIQSDIAKSIAASLEATLSAEEARRIDAVPTESLEAYENYLLGNQRMAKRTVRDLAKAAEYFEQAIRADPEYALAWVGLANAYTLRSQYGGLPIDVIRSKAAGAIDRAFALDQNLAAAYAARGLMTSELEQSESAGDDLIRAIELEPNYAPAYHWYAELLKTDLGRPDLAEEYFEKALALDPRSAVINGAAATNMHMLGRFEEAFELDRRAIEVDVAIPAAYWTDSTLYWAAQGNLVKAVRVLYQARHLDRRSPFGMSLLSLAFLDLEDMDKAREYASEVIALGPDNYAANHAALWGAAHDGETTVAVGVFERMYGLRPMGGLYANTADSLHVLGIAGLADDMRLDLYDRAFPELLKDELPEIRRHNYRAAIDLAGILMRSGDTARAERLLAGSADALRDIPRLGWFGYGIADAEILALRGKPEEAARRIAEARDEGWLLRWWTVERNPNLGGVREHPAVRRIVSDIRADMARQLEDVRQQQATSPLAG